MGETAGYLEQLAYDQGDDPSEAELSGDNGTSFGDEDGDGGENEEESGGSE